MDEPRKRQYRWLLGVLVVAIAAGTIWAATAFAGGSGANNAPAAKPTGKATPAAKAQAKAKANARSGHDCPNRDSGISSSLDV